MADKTSIIIDMKDATTDKSVQRSITYVNPNAENGEMNAFAQAVAGLTSKTFVGATRVDRTELTADTRTPTKIKAYVTSDTSTFYLDEVTANTIITKGITYIMVYGENWSQEYNAQDETGSWKIEAASGIYFTVSSNLQWNTNFIRMTLSARPSTGKNIKLTFYPDQADLQPASFIIRGDN